MGVTTTSRLPAGQGAIAERRRPLGLAAGLAVILLAAAALRLPGIGSASFWADEQATWLFIHLGWSDLVGPIARVEPNPPGHYLFLKAWAAAFGDGEASLRLPSVIAGTLAVVPLALVARRIGGAWAALATAALAAVSAEQIHHAQQARGYALLFLAAAIASWLLGPVLAEDETRRRRAAATGGFVLACLVMLHLHATATLAVAGLFLQAGVVLALRRRRPGRDVLAALVAAGLLVAVGAAWWLHLAIGIAADSGSAVGWIDRPGLHDAVLLLGDELGGFHLGRLKPLAGGLMALTLLAGVVLAARRRAAEPLGLAAGFAFVLLALFGLSQVKPMLLDRTALVLLVFALPLAGYAIAAIRPRGLGVALAVVLLGLTLRGALNRAALFAAEGFGEDWRGAVAALARQAAPGDRVVLLNAPDIGALLHEAPGLVTRLQVEAVAAPGDRLALALLQRVPGVTPLDPARACGLAWTLARETRWEQLAITSWPPPPPGQLFGEVHLRRRPLPPC